jgi:hypothetical protein
MSRIARKTKTRVENLIAWVFAVILILLMAAGAWFLGVQTGVL